MIDDMTGDLLSKHSGFTEKDIKIDAVNVPGKMIVRVSIMDGLRALDWQTATIEPSIQSTIIREASYPEYHPDHPDNKGRTFYEIRERLAKESQKPDEEEKW